MLTPAQIAHFETFGFLILRRIFTPAEMADITRQGLDVLSRYPAGDHAAFRRHEFAAALNRLRQLRVQQT